MRAYCKKKQIYDDIIFEYGDSPLLVKIIVITLEFK